MKLKLNNVRLSYPSLFEAKAGPDGGEPAFSASFILSKQDNATELGTMKNGIFAVAEEAWGKGNVKWNGHVLNVKSGGKVVVAKVCLRDGAEKASDGYGDAVMFFSARSKTQPPVVDKNPSVALTKNSGKPYAGCMVNASVRLWAQDNNFGKRINASLNAVQFASDGEGFGEGIVNAEEEFTNIDSGAVQADNDGWDTGSGASKSGPELPDGF